MSTQTVRLVPVDAGNILQLIRLSVDESQREFVADNLYSLAKAFAIIGHNSLN